MRIEDLPPRYQEQVKSKIGLGGANPCRPYANPATSLVRKPTSKAAGADDAAKTRNLDLKPYSPKSVKTPPTENLRADKMSKTEIAYQRDVLHGLGRFEAITFTLDGGSRYTPDFITIDDGVPTAHEVKGGYRLGSEGRAHTAFFEAAAAWCSVFRFVWAVKEKGGKWNVKHVVPRKEGGV